MKTVALPWGDLRDSYFECLRRIVLPILDIFPRGGAQSPTEWLTRESVEQEFAKFDVGAVRLFDN